MPAVRDDARECRRVATLGTSGTSLDARPAGPGKLRRPEAPFQHALRLVRRAGSTEPPTPRSGRRHGPMVPRLSACDDVA